mmetsp:Transcript_7219/g.29282  ORF Transcript_7219/g.29282 Transcript_7219/m.29282 type:complete len:229 (+) Transcript_7219:303-989(+)
MPIDGASWGSRSTTRARCSRAPPGGARRWTRWTGRARPSRCRGSRCRWAGPPRRRATFDGARAPRVPPSPRARRSASSPGTACTATSAAPRGSSASSIPTCHPRFSAAAAAASSTTACTRPRRGGWRPRWARTRLPRGTPSRGWAARTRSRTPSATGSGSRRRGATSPTSRVPPGSTPRSPWASPCPRRRRSGARWSRRSETSGSFRWLLPRRARIRSHRSRGSRGSC